MTLRSNNLNLKQIFNKKSVGLIHKVYTTQRKDAYIHTASTKTKAQVRGGGRKPRAQKGTGYARSGSIRSPLWVGGGRIFGPKFHFSFRKINKKEKQLALNLTLLSRYSKHLFFYDQLSFIDVYKTKSFLNILRNIFPAYIKQKILIVMSQSIRNLWLSTRNLKNITLTTVACLNINELLKADYILFPVIS